MPQWTYRPTDEEQELMQALMKANPEFTSVAQVVRESVLRFAHESDRSKLFTEVGELIEGLKRDSERFLDLVLKHSGD